MSIRRRATQCLGKLPSNACVSCASNSTSRWPGHHVRWHDEQEAKDLIQANCSSTPVASDRTFRSRDVVKAWLESSPTSVLDDLDDSSVLSSYESFNSSPGGSDHLSCTTRFRNSDIRIDQTNHTKVKSISPPKCRANRNPDDVSRIDAAHYIGGSFLMLGSRNAQSRRSESSPISRLAYRKDQLRESAEEEGCSSPGSDFSFRSEWQYILAAGNASSMKTGEVLSHTPNSRTPYEGLDAIDPDLDFDHCNSRPHPEVLLKPCRTMEIPSVACIDPNDNSTYPEVLLKPCRTMETLGEARIYPNDHSASRKVSDRIVGLMQNEKATAHGRSEKKKATAQGKCVEKAARAPLEAERIRRTNKVPRGCLFLG